jgi:hypothetical protein
MLKTMQLDLHGSIEWEREIVSEIYKGQIGGFLGTLVVAGLALIPNFIPTEKLPWLIGAVVAFVLSSGAMASLLNATEVSYAEKRLNAISRECNKTLAYVKSAFSEQILRGSVIHDTDLDQFEQSEETQEVWVVTPLNLEHDVPGKVFFQSLKQNLDRRNVKYTYIIQDNNSAKYNARKIAEKIVNEHLLTFVLLDDAEWNNLPIVGIPVTIHNPNDAEKLRIYVSTQQDIARGQHWAVFSGWTTSQIIERTRSIVAVAKRKHSLKVYASS